MSVYVFFENYSFVVDKKEDYTRRIIEQSVRSNLGRVLFFVRLISETYGGAYIGFYICSCIAKCLIKKESHKALLIMKSLVLVSP